MRRDDMWNELASSAPATRLQSSSAQLQYPSAWPQSQSARPQSLSSQPQRLSARPQRRFARCGQGGFTLVEVMLALVMGSMIVSVSAAGLYTVTRASSNSSDSLERSNSAFFTSARFASDVGAVGPVAGVSELVSKGLPGCGGIERSALRLVGPGNGGTGVRVRSYAVVRQSDGPQSRGSQSGDPQSGGSQSGDPQSGAPQSDGPVLQRSSCEGPTLAAALNATVVGTPVVRGLFNGSALAEGGTGPVSVTCDGKTDFTDCRTVEMTVRTLATRSFTVRGSVATVLSPTPTTTPAPVVAPPTGTCTIMASETTWGATGGAAGGSGDNHHGDQTMYTYNDTNQRNSFLRFDLTQPCSAPTDTWPRLPGGRDLTDVSLQLAYLGKTGDSCWIFPGVSKDEQVVQPLAGGSTWKESTLKGNSMPTSVIGGHDYKFKVASAGSLTTHRGNGILNSVKQWYNSGGWRNNGWILRRDGVGDTCGDSNKFASRFNANVGLRPRLVIKWG